MKKLFIVLFIFTLLSCSKSAREMFSDPLNPKFVIPPQAIITKIYNEDWVEFELDSNTYLFYVFNSGDIAISGLTLIKQGENK